MQLPCCNNVVFSCRYLVPLPLFDNGQYSKHAILVSQVRGYFFAYYCDTNYKIILQFKKTKMKIDFQRGELLVTSINTFKFYNQHV